MYIHKSIRRRHRAGLPLLTLAFWRAVGEDVNDDPTAHFGLREWADLPVHHPRSPD
jgi:hypothetical protein